MNNKTSMQSMASLNGGYYTAHTQQNAKRKSSKRERRGEGRERKGNISGRSRTISLVKDVPRGFSEVAVGKRRVGHGALLAL